VLSQVRLTAAITSPWRLAACNSRYAYPCLRIEQGFARVFKTSRPCSCTLYRAVAVLQGGSDPCQRLSASCTCTASSLQLEGIVLPACLHRRIPFESEAGSLTEWLGLLTIAALCYSTRLA